MNVIDDRVLVFYDGRNLDDHKPRLIGEWIDAARVQEWFDAHTWYTT